jgi:hypothetical protein
LTLRFTVGERFLDAAEEWGDARMMDTEDALESKAEQALLEIEHLVSGAHEVSFAVDSDGDTATISHEPSDELTAFLAEQSEESGLDEARLLKLHVDLFARVFLDEDTQRPPNAPPKD